MASLSLKYILDSGVEDDPSSMTAGGAAVPGAAAANLIKRTRDPTVIPPAAAAHDSSSDISAATTLVRPSHVSVPGQGQFIVDPRHSHANTNTDTNNINVDLDLDTNHNVPNVTPSTGRAAPAPAPQKGSRRGPSTRGSKSTASAAGLLGSTPTSASDSLVTPPSVPSSLLSTAQPPARRRSTQSNDSMDRSRGYGSTPSSSSTMGGVGGGRNPGGPSRPMPNNPPQVDIPVKLTPITGRVSRAKKGVPVHTCDICKPSKTFTRAEHLRRHQLSHQTPQFPCDYPGCERAFHRSDLLTRHLQKHQEEGKSPPKASDASVRSVSRPPSDSPYGSTRASRPSPGMNPAVNPPGSSGGQAMTPGSQAGYPHTQFNSPPAHTVTPPTPHPLPGTYGASSGEDSYYPLPPKYEMIHPTHDTSLPGPGRYGAYPRPRLDIPAPGLEEGGSGWPSSASTSVSTPASSSSYSRMWVTSSPQVMTHMSTSRESVEPIPTPVHYLSEPYHQPPHPHPAQHYAPSQHSFPNILNIPGQYQTSVHGSNRDSVASVRSDTTLRPNHHHSGSIHALRSVSPPSSGSPHGSEVLMAPSPALPLRDPLVLSRQKMPMGDIGPMELLTATTLGMGPNVLGTAGVAYPTTDGNGGGVLTDVGLGVGGDGGGCAIPTLGLGMEPRQLRDAMPRYMEAYWTHVNTVYPIVHRPTFEANPDNTLRYAMAAVATQYLPHRDDRVHGNELHEIACQEVKSIAQWTTSTMQAILLCELFTRFRGRKAVTRPSNRFESLYSRVSLQLLTSSSASSSSLSLSLSTSENPLLLFESGAAWSSASESSPSDDGDGFSSASSSFPVTPIFHNLNLNVNVPPLSRHSHSGSSGLLRSFGTPFQATSPYSSFSSVYNSSAAASPASSFHSHQSSHPRRQKRSWSALFDPSRYHPPPPVRVSQRVPLAPLSTQEYLPAFPHQQVLYDNPAMFDPAILGAGPDADSRWRTWIEAEARRRLLTACFIIDSHTAIYQQQRRAQDFDLHNMPPILLTGRSTALWEADSAEQWSALLAVHPEYGIPDFGSQTATLTPEDIMARPSFDRLALLSIEMFRLPRNQLGLRSTSPGNSPAIGTDSSDMDIDSHGHAPQHQHQEDHFGGHYNHHQHQHRRAYDDNYETELRISRIFNCPVSNTYLALHHTPLHDLLAVSGDSWIFSQKVLPATSYRENQMRLKAWADACLPINGNPASSSTSAPTYSTPGYSPLHPGMSVARATIYAARAILAFHAREQAGPAGGNVVAPWSRDMSDYWALYVCALIIWASGHRAPPHRGAPTSSANSNGGSPSTRHPPSPAGGSGSGAVGSSDDDALAWLRIVAETSIARAEMDVVRMRGRREAAAVVGLVRRRLEGDCVGGRSRLYKDAVGILRKLEEGWTYSKMF